MKIDWFAIAGIAGVGIGFLLMIFRDIIKKTIFPQLTKEQAFKLLNRMIFLSFIIGVLCICVYAYQLYLHSSKVTEIDQPGNRDIKSTPTPIPEPTPIPSPTSASTPIPTSTPPLVKNEFYQNGLKFWGISCRRTDKVICQFKVKNETDQTIRLKLQGSLYSRASDQSGKDLYIDRVEMGAGYGSNNAESDIPNNLDEPMTAIIEMSSQPGAVKVSKLNLKFDVLNSRNEEFRIIFEGVEINK